MVLNAGRAGGRAPRSAGKLQPPAAPPSPTLASVEQMADTSWAGEFAQLCSDLSDVKAKQQKQMSDMHDGLELAQLRAVFHGTGESQTTCAVSSPRTPRRKPDIIHMPPPLRLPSSDSSDEGGVMAEPMPVQIAPFPVKARAKSPESIFEESASSKFALAEIPATPVEQATEPALTEFSPELPTPTIDADAVKQLVTSVVASQMPLVAKTVDDLLISFFGSSTKSMKDADDDRRSMLGRLENGLEKL